LRKHDGATAKTISSLKRAELLSSVGAGGIGAGVGLLLAAHVARYALPILFVGLLCHAWGMFRKHRLERGEVDAPGWVEAMYWLCWGILALLVLMILFFQMWPSAARSD
jgi:hypothetical protein